MVDQITTAETCRMCGTLIASDHSHTDGLCAECSAAGSPEPRGEVVEAQTAASPYHVPSFVPKEDSPDPDNPGWGPAAGIGVWLASVAAIIVIPIIAVGVWYMIQAIRGVPLPSSTQDAIEWVKSPNVLLVQVFATMLAHVVTIALCWAVVTKLGTGPFLDRLGWHWAGHSFWYWVVFSGCVIVALLGVTGGLSRFLPQSEQNSFAELLKSSQQVRVSIVLLATFTAPMVEETVYRGLLYSGLRRSVGLIPTVVFVTLLFAGVHVLQYWGAWVSVAGLILLSLTLTLLRARTKSILPCVLIHTLNNAFFSVIILLNRS